MYDVIVVGVGPAGCFSAYQLVQKSDINILMLEASKDLKRLKPCGGETDAIIPEEIPELKEILAGESKGYVGYYDGKMLQDKMHSKPHASYTRSLSDKGLDTYLPTILKKKKNIEIKTGQRVDAIQIEKEYAKVICGNNSYKAKVIVDASGAMTRFHERITGHKKKDKYICSVIEFKLRKEDKDKIDEDIIRIDSFPEDPVGCYWVIPYKKLGVVNIGCGFIDNKGQRERLIKYLNFLKLEGWDPTTMLNWIIPINMPKQLCSNRILWIGDTVAMANVETGHSMPNSYKASKQLANTILNALESNDFSKKNLESYQNSKELQEMISKSNRISRAVRIMNSANRFTPKFIKKFFVEKVLMYKVKKYKKSTS